VQYLFTLSFFLLIVISIYIKRKMIFYS
jgi:hypothetical protein